MARPDIKTALIAGLALLIAASGPAQALAQAAGAAPASLDPKVKFKDSARYLGDLSDSLEIPRAEICRELGQYDCGDKAFRIVLGGVDPYQIRIFEPLDHASLASPIAFDRVALQVCTNRVERDKAEPAKAVLFKPSRGAPSKAWLDQTTGRIYDRVLRRDPTAFERAKLSAFYAEVAKGRSRAAPEVQADFVKLGCFAVASSMESAFY